MQHSDDVLSVDALVSICQQSDALLHFVGIAGAGMSALADYRLQAGGRVSGSDRFFDQGKLADEKKRLEGLGALIYPQDGREVGRADLVVASTAVEAQIPDLIAAQSAGVPVVHRAQLLAAHVQSRPTIAIAGTSGKSTVVGMTFAALRGAGLDPGVITGGELTQLQGGRWRGNGYGGSGPLVVEADESDKSLVRYRPQVAVVLNLHKDHSETDAMLPVFGQFCDQATGSVVLASDTNLAPLRPGATLFGLDEDATFRPSRVELDRDSSRFVVEGVEVHVPMPGHHNLTNALGAMAAVHALGADLEGAARGLAEFPGVSRRFDILGVAGGVEVIDDFGHNPAKILAAMKAAKSRGKRLHAVFQPHGFSPTKFMRHDYVRAVKDALGQQDRFYLLEIFYAGGTVTKDISSSDLCSDMRLAGVNAGFIPERSDLIQTLIDATVAGDTIILMGARDPSLGAFAQDIFAALGGKEADSAQG